MKKLIKKYSWLYAITWAKCHQEFTPFDRKNDGPVAPANNIPASVFSTKAGVAEPLCSMLTGGDKEDKDSDPTTE
ncbi:unnamed protein product [Sphenostylis stenocarpa]|uniref:Uncharacterized protein n=1 Tax=Sphenostylis stenocarpa TaxID=92480 RepID=A0AA86W2Z8_9FABA|nr:unnamed protein product [Sphenostylis stenocarpa]